MSDKEKVQVPEPDIDGKEMAHRIEVELVTLKQKKSRSKAVFTRTRNRLKDLCKEENITSEELKGVLEKLEHVMDKYIDSINTVIDFQKSVGRTEDMIETSNELKDCEKSYEDAVREYHEVQAELKSSSSSASVRKHDVSDVPDIGKDLWKQLKSVTIPVFDGETRNYETWKAAFMACIDRAPATPEYKLLQLRQYLKGPALKAIEDLGHSEHAYVAAKDRLERKYGGKRRKIGKYMEELEKFPPVNKNSAKSLEAFADLLDVAVLNIKESELDSELKTGMMYLTLQKKLPEQMLTNYHRWIFETEKDECVESLRDFVIRESEFHTIAAETIHGIGATHKSKQSKQSEKADRSYHSDVKSEKKAEVSSYNRKCQVCNNSHAIWDCAKFKALDIAGRWAKAKDLKLCFMCLKGNHQGSDCRNFRKCGLDGCTKVHNRLLHRCEEKPDVNSSQESTGSLLNPEASVFQSDNFTAYSKSPNYVALRTVPVILKSGKKSVKVNALLDDGSTKTYINADIASNLGLSGQVKSVSVNVLDGQVRTFETMPVNLTLESVDGNSQFEISAFTTNRVTGNLKVLDWNEESKHFPHLQGIHFPRVNTSRPIIDILIGVDHPDIHRSITEIYGRPGEPYARLGPLGWTCIGKPYSESSLVSYFIEGDIENLLRGFWEIETQGIMNLSEPLSHLNQKTMHDTEASFKYKNGRYEVGIPWKETPVLPNSYEMALNRLKGTEKKLNKMPFVKQEYQATIEKYIQKGYIRKVSSEENTHTEIQKKWYLPHFPVIRLDKDSTKVRIVFDASAKIRGVSLNDFIHEGPKLQNELFNVLLRFRKHPIAILCDISEMYLQIQLKQEDRPFHRFLWKSEINPPEEYEFNRVVFGVNASPFLAMFVSRKNAELYQKDFPLAAETVLLSTYMDDSMDSVSDEVTGIQLYTELSALWEKAGMFAKKWLSNSTAVMEQIPLEDRAKEVDLNSGHLPTKKT